MLSGIIRQLLFYLVHLVISVVVAVRDIHKTLTIKRHLSTEEVSEDEVRLLLDAVPRLTKKLDHLVVQTDYEKQTLGELARLVIWCLIAGVPFISFYDVTGVLTENEEKLFCEVEKKKKGVPGCIKWAHRPDLNGYSNGSQSYKIIVNIFKNEDGRDIIANCIQSISEDKLSCERASDEYTSQELDVVISSLYPKIPNPELVLYMGPLCCTHGLLPWQIRLTEFIQLSTDNHVDIKQFLDVLFKYNKCDQRFGK